MVALVTPRSGVLGIANSVGSYTTRSKEGVGHWSRHIIIGPTHKHVVIASLGEEHVRRQFQHGGVGYILQCHGDD